MMSLFNDSDDEEPFSGFRREEQDRLCREWGEEECVDETLSDEMDSVWLTVCLEVRSF